MRFWLLFNLAWRRHWGATLAFAGSLAAFQATLIWGYSFIGGAPTVQNVVGTLSPELRRALKIIPSLQGGFGAREYIALGFYHPIFLGLGAAYVVSRASDGITGSLERGTIWLLLARPISRTQILLSEATTIVLGVGVVLVAGLAGLGIALATSSLDFGVTLAEYLLMTLGSWLLFATLAMLAVLAAATQSRISAAAGVGSALVLGGFVLDLLPWTGDGMLAWLNPWHWYDPSRIISNGVTWRDGTILLMLGLVFGAIALWYWRRRRLM